MRNVCDLLKKTFHGPFTQGWFSSWAGYRDIYWHDITTSLHVKCV